MASSSVNLSLLSIPAYYISSIVPHMYASSILASAGYKVNNANPKASLSADAVKGRVPDEVIQKYERTENAQSNNIEQLPLHAAAVLASIIADRLTVRGMGNAAVNDDVTGLTTFITAFMAVRAAYVVSYINIADHSKSFIRSTFWAIGAGRAFYQIYKAAALLG